jgi:hypothetical protein
MNTALRLVGIYLRFWKTFTLHVSVKTSIHGSQQRYCDTSNIFASPLITQPTSCNTYDSYYVEVRLNEWNNRHASLLITYQKFKHRTEVREVWLLSINLSPQQICSYSFPVLAVVAPWSRKRPLVNVLNFPILHTIKTHTCAHLHSLEEQLIDCKPQINCKQW